MLKIKIDYPPNFEEIKKTLNPAETTVFVYGDTIYNPNNNNLEEHILIHEQTHIKQQDDPKEWWRRYLSDPQFRLDQELEAYRNQYQYIKQHFSNKILKESLSKMAFSLSGGLYGNLITYQEAETKIRHGKEKT